jgi:integrase
MALEKTKYDGLYYRLDKNGKKVYVARIYKDGKDTTKTLGKEPQLNLKVANKMRLDILEELSQGYSLKNINKKNNELFKEYLSLRKNSLSSTYIYATEKNYNKYLKNRIGDFHPKDLTTSNIQKIINEMLESGKAPQTAKAIKEIVVAFYKFLPELGIHNIDNIGKAIKIPKFDNSRVIELTDEQTKKLFESLFTYHDIKIRTIFIWLLHGRRKGEVLNIRWEDIDFEKNIYTIDSSISKIKKTLQFSLTDTLITALKDYGIRSIGLVFASNQNENQIMSKTGMDYHWKNIRISTGLAKLNMHDLRHIVGGYGVNNGFSLEVVGKTLGHTTANITQRYSKVQRETVKTVIDSLFEAYKPRDL